MSETQQPAPSSRLRISTPAPTSRVLLHCDPTDRAAAEALLGVALAGDMLRTASTDAWTALHLAPDEWLLIGRKPQAALPDHEGSAPPLSLVEVSDRFRAILLEGPAAADVLQAGCPVDLDPDRFPPGTCTRAPLGKCDMTLWRKASEQFELLIARSYFPYALAFLERAAADLHPFQRDDRAR